MLKTARQIGFLLAITIIWQLFSLNNRADFAISSPYKVVIALWEMLSQGLLFSDAWASVKRVLIGMALGTPFAVALGVATGRITFLYDTIGTLMQLLRAIPVIAVVPFALLWFGVSETGKFVLIVWGIIFPIWIAIHSASKNLDPRIIWAAKSLGASQYSVYVSVVLPALLPNVISSIRVAVGIGYLCVVGAELAGADSGLGYRIWVSHLVFRADRMIAVLIVLGLLTFLTDYVITRMSTLLWPWSKPRG